MSKTSCDNATEFECTSGSIKCIPRSSVNNRVQDCSDGSDENIVDFNCFEYEFRCFTYILPKNRLFEFFILNRKEMSFFKMPIKLHEYDSDMDYNLQQYKNFMENFDAPLNYTKVNRCISYEMVKNNQRDCFDNEDEKTDTLILETATIFSYFCV